MIDDDEPILEKAVGSAFFALHVIYICNSATIFALVIERWDSSSFLSEMGWVHV